MPSQHNTTWCDFVDQSDTACSKPKIETVSKQHFHWLIFYLKTYPGWAFSFFFGSRGCDRWPAKKLKLIAAVLWGANKCLRPQVLSKIFYISVLRFFPVFFSSFFQVCCVFHVAIFRALFCCVFALLDRPVLSLFSRLYPRLHLLFRHIRYNAWWFSFVLCFFFPFCLFSSDNNMLFFLRCVGRVCCSCC